MISTVEHSKKRIKVFNKEMSYVEKGEGENTILFLHGNPQSSSRFDYRSPPHLVRPKWGLKVGLNRLRVYCEGVCHKLTKPLDIEIIDYFD